MRKGSHSVFNIQLHIVFITKYRNKVINEAKKRLYSQHRLLGCAKRINARSRSLTESRQIVHLLLDFHPDNNLSSLIGSMKSASSRVVRGEFKEIVDKYYWKDKFWSDSYCAVSCGGAPLEIVRQYIQSQDKPKS